MKTKNLDTAIRKYNRMLKRNSSHYSKYNNSIDIELVDEQKELELHIFEKYGILPSEINLSY